MPDSRSLVETVVLVVEDEPLLLMHALDVVEGGGFTVVAASSADEAIAVLHARSDIRIVFTDIDMPGSMDGLRLAAVVRDRWPPVELILTSGHVRPRTEDLPARGLFFSKPYDDATVVEAMKRFAA